MILIGNTDCFIYITNVFSIKQNTKTGFKIGKIETFKAIRTASIHGHIRTR
jgi:hypothetical protein